MPCSVFISYRRDDSAAEAASLRDAIETRIGAGSVFLDVDASSVSPGSSWPDGVRAALRSARVVLVVIGRRWLTAGIDEWVRRRIDAEDDWVRLEIETALVEAKHIIPVRVAAATLPPADALPMGIRRVLDRRDVEVRHDHRLPDIRYLVDEVARVLGVESAGTWGAAFTWLVEQQKRRVTAVQKCVAIRSRPYSELRQLILQSASDPGALAEVASLRAALLLLADMPPRCAGELDPLHEFVIRADARYPSDRLKTIASEWARQLPEGEHALTRLRERIESQRENATTPLAHLCVDITGASPATVRGLAPLEYWLYVGRECVLHGETPHGLPLTDVDPDVARRAVESAFREIWSRAMEEVIARSPGSTLVIQFYASFDQLGWDVDQWSLEDSSGPSGDAGQPIASLYPVLVGWADRVAGSRERINLWKAACDRILKDQRLCATPSTYWIVDAAVSRNVVKTRVATRPYGACIGLGFVPDLHRPHSQATAIVAAVLEGGAPFALWLRGEPASWAGVRLRLEQVVREGPLDQLPLRCAHLRRDEGDTAMGAARRMLTVLWDHPEHNPLVHRLPGLGQRA